MSGVAGINGVYVVVVDETRKDANVFFVSGTMGYREFATTLTGRAPFTVACTFSDTAGETSIIMDADGNVWRGPCRPQTGRSFQPVEPKARKPRKARSEAV
jgi:hypothetical protein